MFCCRSPLKAQILTFVYVQSELNDDQSFYLDFLGVFFVIFRFLLYMLYRQLCLFGVSCLGTCTYYLKNSVVHLSLFEKVEKGITKEDDYFILEDTCRS